MRARLLSKIKGTNQIKITDLTKRVICSLFLDFLKRENFQYTPTVFVPECGAIDKLLSPGEIKEILHLPEVPEESMLEHILERIKLQSTRPHASETYVQTEETPATGLESRLQQLDAEFLYKTRGVSDNSEEKMLKFKRECEERMRFEINSELTRMREVEMSAVRIEEAGKYRALLQKMRTEQEEHWKSQLDLVKEREKEQRERIAIREKDLESREHRQRQQFQKELEIVKTKESDMKRGVEIELEAARLQRNSWEQKKMEVENKLKDMENFKAAMSSKAQDDFLHFRREFEANFDEEKRRVYGEKHELQTLRESLSLEMEKIKRNEERVKEQNKEIGEISKRMEYYKEEYEKASRDINRNREELRLVSETSRRDLDMLSFKDQELAAVRNECKAYKDLYFEQKEALKKYEANQQLLFEKLARENVGTEPHIESEFMAERKNAWKKLEKESLDIKKSMIEVFNSGGVTIEHPRTSFRPYKSHVDGKYRTEAPQMARQDYPHTFKAREQEIIEESKGSESNNEYSQDNYEDYASDPHSPRVQDDFYGELSESNGEKKDPPKKTPENLNTEYKKTDNVISVAKQPENKTAEPKRIEIISDISKTKVEIKHTEKAAMKIETEEPFTKKIEKPAPVVEKPQLVFSEESSRELGQNESVESSSHDSYF